MNSLTNINRKKRIAIIAHEDNNIELINWSYQNKQALMQHDILAAGSAVKILEGTLNVHVRRLINSNEDLAAMIGAETLDAIIVFSRPLMPVANGTNVQELLKLSVAADLLVAITPKTADLILKALESAYREDKTHSGGFNESSSRQTGTSMFGSPGKAFPLEA